MVLVATLAGFVPRKWPCWWSPQNVATLAPADAGLNAASKVQVLDIFIQRLANLFAFDRVSDVAGIIVVETQRDMVVHAPKLRAKRNDSKHRETEQQKHYLDKSNQACLVMSRLHTAKHQFDTLNLIAGRLADHDVASGLAVF